MKKVFGLIFVCLLAAGCATKSLRVTVPAAQPQPTTLGYVRIDQIKDLRNFVVAPKHPSIPSIEGDHISDTAKTDTSIGRMRHGMFHHALWNYTLKDDKNIYEVCEEIVSSSLTIAGYAVVTKGNDQYGSALPLSIEILQFWAWMQPKFNIDLYFDGELKVISMDPENSINVTAKSAHMFSTGMANGSNWTKLVNQGVSDLQSDLVSKLKPNERF